MSDVNNYYNTNVNMVNKKEVALMVAHCGALCKGVDKVEGIYTTEEKELIKGFLQGVAQDCCNQLGLKVIPTEQE